MEFPMFQLLSLDHQSVLVVKQQQQVCMQDFNKFMQYFIEVQVTTSLFLDKHTRSSSTPWYVKISLQVDRCDLSTTEQW